MLFHCIRPADAQSAGFTPGLTKLEHGAARLVPPLTLAETSPGCTSGPIHAWREATHRMKGSDVSLLSCLFEGRVRCNDSHLSRSRNRSSCASKTVSISVPG